MSTSTLLQTAKCVTEAHQPMTKICTNSDQEGCTIPQSIPDQLKIHTNPSKPVKPPYWVGNQEEISSALVPNVKSM